MAHLWNYIVETNTLNFIVLAIILLFAFKKINLPEMISKLQQNIENAVNESTLAKTKSQEALKIAEEKMENVDKEVENIVKFIKKDGNIVYDTDIMEKIDKANEPEKVQQDDNENEDDPLLEDAIEMVVETQQASTSFIQRRFKVGYARAGRSQALRRYGRRRARCL